MPSKSTATNTPQPSGLKIDLLSPRFDPTVKEGVEDMANCSGEYIETKTKLAATHRAALIDDLAKAVAESLHLPPKNTKAKAHVHDSGYSSPKVEFYSGNKFFGKASSSASSVKECEPAEDSFEIENHDGGTHYATPLGFFEAMKLAAQQERQAANPDEFEVVDFGNDKLWYSEAPEGPNDYYVTAHNAVAAAKKQAGTVKKSVKSKLRHGFASGLSMVSNWGGLQAVEEVANGGFKKVDTEVELEDFGDVDCLSGEDFGDMDGLSGDDFGDVDCLSGDDF